jgi:dienelactone hydrolase
MRERPIHVGAQVTLAGILTEPAEQHGAPTTAVLLLNAGVLHRVGANRLNVTLARRLAAQGLLAVRFDSAGIGESASRGPRASVLRPEVADTVEVMDYVQQTRGITRFLLIGLCSGAENALTVAAGDERVVGVVALEGFAYPTRQFWLRRYAPRLLNPGAVRGILSGENSLYRRLRGWRKDDPAVEGPFSLRAALGSRRLPPQTEVEDYFQRLVARRVALLAVYAGGSHHYFNYTGQLRAAFPRVAFGNLLDVEHVRGADHTFTDVVIRRRLVERISTWAAARGMGKTATSSNQA